MVSATKSGEVNQELQPRTFTLTEKEAATPADIHRLMSAVRYDLLRKKITPAEARELVSSIRAQISMKSLECKYGAASITFLDKN